MTRIIPISPVVVITATTDPNANGEYDLPTLVRLETEKILRNVPALSREDAEALASFTIQDRLRRPNAIGLESVDVDRHERRLETENSHADWGHR